MPVSKTALCIALLIATSIAAPARAGDGAFEINQTCATTGGCFPGDSGGFPVTLREHGTYVLTSSLTLSTANQTAISVSSTTDPIVTIDLRGFAITGVVTCTGEPAVCSGTGTGKGISGGVNATIRNGTVRGMGDAGITTGAGASVENMLVKESGSYGIQISGGGGSRRAIIHGNRVIQNGDDGVSSSWQDGDGNYAGNIISGNVVAGNAGYGIRVNGATVMGNVVVNNLTEGLGLFSGGKSGYGDNLLFGNNGGSANPQVSQGLEISGNLCGTDAVCP